MTTSGIRHPAFGISVWHPAFRIPHAAFGVALLLAAPSLTAAGEVRAGVAKEVFSLPRWVPLAGYSKRHGAPSRGWHDPVGARALVVQDGPTTVALVSCDLLIVDESLFDAVRRRLLAGGMPGDVELVLAATHTHSGPGAYGTRFLEKISMGHFDPAVFEELVRAITQAVLRARGSLAPVRMASMSAMTDGLVTNRVDPGGLADAELIVRAFYREAESTPFAILMNFAAHPTALGAWNMELSADYPGVAVDAVERRVSGSTCLFTAGAVGDQAPVKSGSGFERASRIGEALARQVVTLLDTARPTIPRAARAAQELMTLPPARVRLGSRVTLPRWLGKRLVDDDARLSIAAIGATVFIGVPCDLSAELGRQLKAAARARGLDPVIVGFASDYIGYCMPRAFYQTHAYESLMALNGPDTGELVVSRLTQMLDRLAAK